MFPTTSNFPFKERTSIQGSPTYLSVAGFTELLDVSGGDVRVVVTLSTLVHGEPPAYPALPGG